MMPEDQNQNQMAIISAVCQLCVELLSWTFYVGEKYVWQTGIDLILFNYLQV